MKIGVKIEPDSDGYTGRECPACEKYFKIKFGTGLANATKCHCPYCNHQADQDEFWTKQQIEYAKSIAFRKVSDDILGSLKKLERKPSPKDFISIGISVKGQPAPIAYYREKELEEKLTCSNCTLDYTIYGAFAFCPDCGIHNSRQILHANFDLIETMLELPGGSEVKTRLIENSLEDAVSSFDGFARECCSQALPNISFQNIEAANKKLIDKLNLDFESHVSTDDWKFTLIQFQKRHLFAHKLGIIDQAYIDKTGCSTNLLGRKVSIDRKDVDKFLLVLKSLADILFRTVEVANKVK